MGRIGLLKASGKPAGDDFHQGRGGELGVWQADRLIDFIYAIRRTSHQAATNPCTKSVSQVQRLTINLEDESSIILYKLR